MFVFERSLFASWLARGIILLAVFSLATAYDSKVSFAGTEPRWMILHLAVLLSGAVYLFGNIPQWPLRLSNQPVAVWAGLAFCAAAALSMLDTIELPRSWWMMKNILACLGLFVLVIALRDDRWYLSLAWTITLTVGLNGILGIFQFHDISDAVIAEKITLWRSLPPLIDGFYQARPPAATFVNKNLAASYLVLGLPLAAALALASRPRILKIAALVCLVLGAVLLVYTRTRASWLALLIACGVLCILVAIHGPTRGLLRDFLSKRLLITVFVAAAIVVYAGALPTGLEQNVARLTVSERMSSVLDARESPIQGRLASYLNGLKIALDHPVNGVGIGAFRAAYPLYHDAWVETPRSAYDFRRRWYNIHNDWLQAFVELGAPGGVAQILFFLGVLAVGYRVATSTTKSPEVRILSLGGVAAILGLGINAVASFPLQTPTAGLMWGTAGMLIGWSKSEAGRSEAPQTVTTKLPRFAAMLAFVLCLLSLVYIGWSDYKRKAGGKYYIISMFYFTNPQEPDSARAIRAIDLAYRLDPWNRETRHLRAMIYARDRDHKFKSQEEILAAIREALRYDRHDATLLVALGKQLIRGEIEARAEAGSDTRGNLAELREILERLKVSAGFHVETIVIEGFIALLSGDAAAALKDFKRATELNPNDPFLRYGRQLSKNKIFLAPPSGAD